MAGLCVVERKEKIAVDGNIVPVYNHGINKGGHMKLYRIEFRDNFSNTHYRNYNSTSATSAKVMASIYHRKWHVVGAEEIIIEEAA